MKTRLYIFRALLVVMVTSMLFSACRPKQVTPSPTAQQSTQPTTQVSESTGLPNTSTPARLPTATATTAPLPDSGFPVKDSGEPIPPQLIERQPSGGQELSLRGEVTLVFNQPMNPDTTAESWKMTDAEGEQVEGKISWPNTRTLHFTSDNVLKTNSVYLASLSTQATSARGQALIDPVSFQATTVSELKVSQVFPADGSQEIDNKAIITVIFNRPVVPLVVAEEKDRLVNPLTIAPAVDGKGEWINTSVFAFRPTKPLNTGTVYTVLVKSGLADAGNETLLNTDFQWQFTTGSPRIDSLILKNGTVNPAPGYPNFLLDEGVTIRFFQPMDRSSTEASLSITNEANGELVPYNSKWVEDDLAIVITPTQRLALNTNYLLHLDASAQAADGGNLREGLDWPFQTIPRPGVALTYPGNGDTQNYFTPDLYIKFKSPMRLDTVKERIKIKPEPAKDIQWYYNDYDWSMSAFILEPSTRYKITFQAGMEDIYGNKTTADEVIQFTTTAYSPQAGLQMPYGVSVVRSDGPQGFYVSYRNIASLDVRLYKLTTQQLVALLSGQEPEYYYRPEEAALVWRDRVKNENKKNELGLTELAPRGADGNVLEPGAYFIGLDTPNISHPDTPFLDHRIMVVATANLTFKSTGTEALIWATDLTTAKPLENLKVTVYNAQKAAIGDGVTDSNGLLKLDVPIPADPYENRYVIVDGDSANGKQYAIANSEWGSGTSLGDYGLWSHYYAPVQQTKAYIYTDRPIYRPGQPVYFKGIVRTDDDLTYRVVDKKDILVRITNYQETVFQEILTLNENGSFEGKLSLDTESALGYYSIEVYLTAEDLKNNVAPISQLGFSVAQYRKPEFQVSVASDKSDVLANQTYTINLAAEYYSGGGVADAQVEWTLRAEIFDFNTYIQSLTADPLNLARFNFSDFDQDIYTSPQFENPYEQIIAQGKGKTDAAGQLKVNLVADLSKYKSSMRFTFEATVTDIAQTAVTGRTTVVAHRGEYYVGARTTSYVGLAKEEQTFEVTAVDWNARPLPGKTVTVEIVERKWYSVQEQDASGRIQWSTSVQDLPVASFPDITLDQNAKATVKFTPPNGGIFRARVTIQDTHANITSASAYMWVSADEFVPWRQTNDRNLNLVADKATYVPGETAEILIASPFQGEAYALVTVERGHIRSQEVLHLTSNSTVYRLPVTKDLAPNAFVSVLVVKGIDDTNPRPNYKMGILRLVVSTQQQEIAVQISTDKPQAGPGGQVTYTIRTLDYEKKPVSTEVSLSLTDLATLSLADPNAPPVLTYFYSSRSLGVWTSVPIEMNLEDYNANIKEHLPTGGGMGSGGGKGGGDFGVIAVRQNFPDTPYWNAFVKTDANGEARVTVTLPDNLTTWRMDARVVTNDTRVGQSTHDIISTKLLLVRPQTPRFFIVGDQTTIGAAIHNNSEQSLTVDVMLDVQGMTLQSADTQQVQIPAGRQAYVSWPATVNPEAQRVDLVISAQGGGYADASRAPQGTLDNQGLPVYRYQARETVGTSGLMSEAGTRLEAINLPGNLSSTEGSLDISISPSLAAGMTDGLTYLEQYPYECIEQTISKMLPNVISTKALKSAGLSNPDLEKKLQDQVSTALQRLYNWQHADGGWGWWPDNQNPSDLQTSAYVVLGLVEAKEAGYEVSQPVIYEGLLYLSNQILPVTQFMDPEVLNRQAFVLYVLARGGRPEVSDTVQIYDQRLSMNLYAQSFLAQTLSILDKNDPRIATLLADFNNTAIQSATGSHWEETRQDRWNWNTDTRTTAIVLMTLSNIDSKNPLAANAARWLMSHRQNGHWQGTQETAWVLMALTNWMVASGELQANYQFAFALNGQRISGGTADAQTLRQNFRLQIKISDLLKDEANRLVFARSEGAGNLYYTAHLNVTLPVEQIKALSQGIIISRNYYRLTDLQNPVKEAKVGDLLLARLTIVAPSALHYLVVDDPLPAGLEAVDQSLLTNQQNISVPQTYTWDEIFMRGWGWWWFEHIQLRDEKVVLSANNLPAGTYVYTYMVRAATAGNFRVIPPTAQEFYFPEMYGRGEGSLFIVTQP